MPREGLDAKVRLRFLISDIVCDDVQQREVTIRRMRTASEPTFIFANKYVVREAQPPELRLRVIFELAGLLQTQASQFESL